MARIIICDYPVLVGLIAFRGTQKFIRYAQATVPFIVDHSPKLSWCVEGDFERRNAPTISSSARLYRGFRSIVWLLRFLERSLKSDQERVVMQSQPGEVMDQIQLPPFADVNSAAHSLYVFANNNSTSGWNKVATRLNDILGQIEEFPVVQPNVASSGDIVVCFGQSVYGVGAAPASITTIYMVRDGS